jgi:hypothetical protein
MGTPDNLYERGIIQVLDGNVVIKETIPKDRGEFHYAAGLVGRCVDGRWLRGCKEYFESRASVDCHTEK